MFGISFGPKSVSVTEAYDKLGTEGHCLLDVRTRDEVRTMSVPGAVSIPLDRLAADAPQLASYASIHVLCRSGGRSAMATQLLHELGMTQAENITGGILAWEAAGLPTT